ncbi:hypothetical protein [Streptomyces sp. NPDC046939]|uniref:hypothetical protein n=1 Tax=Streptomyces sp. NPDC046939 TaxID=3155376 RepID=UPI0033F5A057
MNPVWHVLTPLIGYGVEQFLQSRYGVFGVFALAVLTLLWSAERKSTPWAFTGVVLALLVLAQA